MNNKLICLLHDMGVNFEHRVFVTIPFRLVEYEIYQIRTALCGCIVVDAAYPASKFSPITYLVINKDKECGRTYHKTVNIEVIY